MLCGQNGAGELGPALFQRFEPFLQLVAPCMAAFHDHDDVV